MTKLEKINECISEFFEIHHPCSIDKSLEHAIRRIIESSDDLDAEKNLILKLYELKDFMRGLSNQPPNNQN